MTKREYGDVTEANPFRVGGGDGGRGGEGCATYGSRRVVAVLRAMVWFASSRFEWRRIRRLVNYRS